MLKGIFTWIYNLYISLRFSRLRPDVWKRCSKFTEPRRSGVQCRPWYA